MSCCERKILSATESVCPECLARIPARRVERGGDVYLEKACPQHGPFRVVLWRGQPEYSSWLRPKTPAYPEAPFTGVERGCPFDCGLCPEHRQQTCTALLEVTGRCDLGCRFCFADAGGQDADPDLGVIEGWYRKLLEAGTSCNVQLSGGEPCLRDDLPEIVALGRSLGFRFIQVNTNGLRFASDPLYLKRLKEAGLSSVFLQFDGTEGQIHERLRGGDLLSRKVRAVERCAENDVGVVLVPTLVPGVNTHNVGAIVRFALGYTPAVRGVHFQPVSYFGRYPQPPGDGDRITIPEVIRAIEEQTGGLVRGENFGPPGCENALCSFHGNFVLMKDGSLKPLTRRESCCCSEKAEEGAAKARAFVARNWALSDKDGEDEPSGGPSLGGWDEFLARARTHVFCISGMAFQDAWNLDLERLRDCCIHVVSPDGRIVPFCAYNLTDRQGRALYRQVGNTARQGEG